MGKTIQKITVNRDDIKIRKKMAPGVKVHNPKNEYKRMSENDIWNLMEEEEYADDYL